MYTKKWLPSPFFEGRNNYPLDMIIIHHIGSNNGKLYSVDGTLTWFTDIEVHKNKETGKIENKVSAHYVIPRQNHKGNDLYHLVKDIDIAYHAGESQWVVNNKLRKYINKYSIGIELEGDGNLIEYTEFQYEVLIWLIKDLIKNYNIPEENILGHEDIAPGRKVDPGKLFDWKKLRSSLTTTSEHISIKEDNTKKENSPLEKSPPENSLNTQEKNKEQEKFFMEDGSKTHNNLSSFLKLIINLFIKIIPKK
jgi:N-acetyl-anhydromuramyl-L-alanine amidase AmpD